MRTMIPERDHAHGNIQSNTPSTRRGRRVLWMGARLSALGCAAILAACTPSGGGAGGERDAAFSRAIRSSAPPSDFALAVVVIAPAAQAQSRAVIIPGRDGRPGSTSSIAVPVPATPAAAAPTAPPSAAAGGLGSASEAASATAKTGAASAAPAPKPARYVMDADWILRAGVGLGAREDYFPYQARQLNAAQVQRLWERLVASGLLAPDHPGIIARVPPIPEVGSEEARSDPAWSQTRYIVSYTVAGTRRLLMLNESDMGAETEGGAGKGDSGKDTGAAKARTLAEEFARLAWVEAP